MNCIFNIVQPINGEFSSGRNRHYNTVSYTAGSLTEVLLNTLYEFSTAVKSKNRWMDGGEENERWTLQHEEKHVFPSTDRRDFLFMTFVTSLVYRLHATHNKVRLLKPDEQHISWKPSLPSMFECIQSNEELPFW